MDDTHPVKVVLFLDSEHARDAIGFVLLDQQRSHGYLSG